MLGRVFEHGYPWDVVFNTRLMSLIRNNLPGPLARALINYSVNKRFNHENYGLQPEKRYFLVAPNPHGVTGLVLHTGRFPTANIKQCPDRGDIQREVCNPGVEDKGETCWCLEGGEVGLFAQTK